MTKYELEDRLITFSTQIIGIAESVTKSYTGNQLSTQLLRSGTSVSLNYGEAQSAELRKDFIHKIKLILKELRETNICLKLIKNRHLVNKVSILDNAMNENNELISIFVKSIQTARKNDLDEKK
jgi:four helix bundle protein